MNLFSRFFTILFIQFLLTLRFLSPINAQSENTYEQITDFHSVIKIQEDGSLNVSEKITVISTGNEIKHGIYRDFPTKYAGIALSPQKGFEIISVTKDNEPEPYNMQKMSNGYRLYIGDKNTLLPPGPYTYTIDYTTTNQLGFFKDYDELYWNVTGSNWSFPITQCSAEIYLPFPLIVMMFISADI
ncbi:hypothetical protein LDC_2185 [sediment metagenome]|uniref:DUF2207 domain-containing protein n=1 Tax=sediment metagenome TaxID=749907 RepID=D9PKW4_9ZZZZ